MIYLEKPSNFQAKFEIVSCFCEKENTLLLLHRQNHKPQGDQWGFPAGKVGENETPIEAMTRELEEETGIKQPKEKIIFLQTVYDRYPEYDFLFHMFQTKITPEQQVQINPQEYKEYLWVTPKEAMELNYMEDLDLVTKLFYDIEK